jgi:hypothetical protein
MTFLQALNAELNTTTTENGAKSYRSTLDSCLDFFGQIGASRNNLSLVEKSFLQAYQENPETAIRILFYGRDCRGGQGERNVFRILLKKLAIVNPNNAIDLINLVPFYGRWDDLLILEGTQVWPEVLKLFKYQLEADLAAEKPSLLAKWLPSINASSKESKRIGRIIASYMNWSERQYRKVLSSLRAKIKIVETSMCSKEWSEINYEKVPSQASMMYRNAFKKHDGPRYEEYLSTVEQGKAKINAATLYPYDIVREYLYQYATNDKTLELQWNSLPDYMEGLEFNGLVVADVSRSMRNFNGLPLAVSISLAIYIAERNRTELWKNKFITFSSSPSLQTIVGTNIEEKVRNLQNAEWSMSTNLISVFNAILEAGINNKIEPKDMPQKLIIVSDMQFDQACKSNKRTNFEQIQNLYRKSGYELPELIFWNVYASDNVPITKDENGTCLVSGCSPSVLKSVLTGKVISPIEIMNETVYSERYAPIGKVFA